MSGVVSPKIGGCATSPIYGGLPARAERSLRAEAEAFLDLLSMEPAGPGVTAARRSEVLRDIQSHGLYEHTPEELLWGCRFAWRHSVRCVGRYFWKQLEVRDARQCTSVEEVAAGCIDHVRLATNGGAIRPLVTVFAPEREGGGSMADLELRVGPIRRVFSGGW